MSTVSGKPNEMLGGTDFIYPPFISEWRELGFNPGWAMVL